MKRVYVAKNPADAHLLKGLLEGVQIEAVVRGEFLWGVRGEVPVTPETCPSVWVDDDDYDKAMELVETFRVEESRTRKIPEEEWKCATCGEANDGQFTECWRCGKARAQS